MCDDLDGVIARAIDDYMATHPDVTVREIMRALWRLNAVLLKALHT